MMGRIIIILNLVILNSTICAFAQRPKDGVYLVKYFDVEYNKFNGTCKLIVYKDSVAAYAVTDCHRTPGTLIEKGLLVKNKFGEWVVCIKQDDVPSKIDFKKKIFYSF